MKEKLKHIEAFNYYYVLGDKRTLQLVAKKFTVSRQSISKWKREFFWQDRIESRDIKNGKKLEEKTDKAIVNSKADYRALIKKVVKKFEEKLKDGKIRIEKPEDLNVMAKLDLLMMGEATDINETKGLDDLDKKLSRLTLNELKKLSKANAGK